MLFLNQKTAGYQCGSKANNLFTLQRLGFRVPYFVVIPQEVLLTILSAAGESDSMAYIQRYTIPEKELQVLLSNFPSSAHLAVRSSAVDEDGAEHSFAGQFSSYLYVSKEELGEAIKKVWLSAFSKQVSDYRQHKGLAAELGIAVIVQEMIPAETAGVAFGIHPVSGNRKEKVISAVYGLGEGLVSGELNADTFCVENQQISESTIAAKTTKLVWNREAGKGTIAMPVESNMQNKPALDELQVKEVAQVLDNLGRHFKKYQDIEFAFCNNSLYLLQTRPVTTMKQLPDISGRRMVWDNSNIIESYPGLTTPLTFSFISKVYEAVYLQFVGLMGVSGKDVEENKELFAHMLGLLNGRVYYNLLSWYKALALLPGYSLNAGFMEKMMGVKERFDLKDVKKRSKFTERLRVLNMIGVMLKNLWSLPEMREDFVKEFNAVMYTYDVLDFGQRTPEELMQLYLRFERTLLKKWKAPLVNDFFAMIYFGVLQKLVVKYGIDRSGSIHNDLMCGARDIISTEPVKRCVKIATLVQQNEEDKQLFLGKTAEALCHLWQQGKLNPRLSLEISEYLQRFGNRCVGELKLETITYRQNPEIFLQIIKSYVEQGVTEKTTHSNIDQEMRRAAEKKVNLVLKRKPLKRLLFNYFLRQSRILVSARENLRYERTRAFGVVRELFCSMGDRFFAEGLIGCPRDIFYLSKEEIFSYINGTSLHFNLKELIAVRKREYAVFEATPTTERIETYGMVYLGNDFFKQKQETQLKGDLKGLACCPGRVRAKVQVIRRPNEVKNLNGAILVTSSTDPGWVTLFPTASGILVERGSLLSHSAIVSREMGKPCIVGITGLLERLKSGDEVEMDGSTGEIKILNT